MREKNLRPESTEFDHSFGSNIVKTKLNNLRTDLEFLSRLTDEHNVDVQFINFKFGQLYSFMAQKLKNVGLDQSRKSVTENMEFEILEISSKLAHLQALRDHLGIETSADENYKIFTKMSSELMAKIGNCINKINTPADGSANLIDLTDSFTTSLSPNCAMKNLKLKKNVYKSMSQLLEGSIRIIRKLNPDLVYSVTHQKSKVNNENTLVYLDYVRLSQHMIDVTRELILLEGFKLARLPLIFELVSDLGAVIGEHFVKAISDIPIWTL